MLIDILLALLLVTLLVGVWAIVFLGLMIATFAVYERLGKRNRSKCEHKHD